MRVAIYARVSTKDQSYELQLRDLRTYCSARSFDPAREYKAPHNDCVELPLASISIRDAEARALQRMGVSKWNGQFPLWYQFPAEEL